jgi:tryptophan synthase alpha chain
MSRIAATFAALRAKGRKALIPYITAGDPFADATVDIMLALARGGADVIELGVPFSDPMADGPVIQKASERALAKGIGMPQVRDAGLDPIFLLAPTSTDQRIREVARIASGYVYYVSLKGVTGAGHLDTAAVAQMVPRIKAHVKLPVGVGFGIRDAATARAVAAVADAVVIGSALVQLLETRERGNVAAAAADFIGGIRAALDS